MARPRSAGGTSLTRSPSIEMSPEVISSSPAIIRSRVDLPQPEGPTKTHELAILDCQVDALDDLDVAIGLVELVQRDGRHARVPLPYFTAPKVRPRTSCRWLIQPNTRIGAIAIVEAAESFAQNRPFGRRERGDEGGERCRLRGGQVEAPEGLVPAQDDREQAGRRDARQGQRHQQLRPPAWAWRRPCARPRGCPSAPP